MLRMLLVLCLISACSDGAGPRQSEFGDLEGDLKGEIEVGRVTIEAVAGNGSSSGTSITANLISRSSSTLSIDINLGRPIFFTNGGRGQNMVALQVFGADGAYISSGQRSFISLPANSRTPVVFVAFCMDFEKDNPTKQDDFTVGSLPTPLEPVVERIGEYLAFIPNSDVVSAAQAAIWLAQGVPIADIRARFPITAADEVLAQRFLSSAGEVSDEN